MDRVLSQDTCRDRLSRSRHGFLACTERALPTVLPAEMRLRHGRLLVTVSDPARRDQLLGQVVALGVGRRALWFRRGWRVVARGQIAPSDDDLALSLEGYQLAGASYGRSRARIDQTERIP